MAQRPFGTKSVVMAADGWVINARNKIAYSLIVAFQTGAVAGDRIGLRDGGPTGRILAYVIIPSMVTAIYGTLSIPLGRYGINFSAGIYYTELVTAAGNIWTTVAYD